MPLPADGLQQLKQLLENDASDQERLAQIRAGFPGLSLTSCDAGDMDAEPPVIETARFCLYLIDTHEHCVHLTHEPDRASGLILARKKAG